MNSIKMIMIGYSDGNKAYKVYDPVTMKAYVRREVIFDEHSRFDNTVLIESPTQDDKLNRIFERNEEITCDKDKTDELWKQKSPRRNPRQPIPREPYSLRARDASSLSTEYFAKANAIVDESRTLQEAMESEDSARWMKAKKRNWTHLMKALLGL